jgi:hypothetical protein
VHQAEIAPGHVRLIGGVDRVVRALRRMTFFALVSASLLLCFPASPSLLLSSTVPRCRTGGLLIEQGFD